MKKIKLDILGKVGFGIVLVAALLSLFGYWLAPDASTHANTMHLNIANQSPGFSVTVLRIPNQKPKTSALQQLFFGKTPYYQEIPISHYTLKNDGLTYAPFVAAGYEIGFEQTVSLERFHSLSAAQIEENHIVKRRFLLGTDKFGRDLLSRLILGTRVSFSVGFIAVFISLLIGIPLGLYAGFYGGRLDALIMWFVQVMWSVPTLLLVIAFTLALGKGFWQVFIAVGLTMWVEVARMVRGQVMSLRKKEFVEAATALAYPDNRIIWRHILPNVLAPVIVISAANFSSAILIESGLSFLGIGAQPPMPSWGGMIKDHYPYLITGKAYLAVFPGLSILLLVLAFMLIGNSLRDALDVRLKSR